MFSHTGAKITASLKKRTEVTGNSIFFSLEGGDRKGGCEEPLDDFTDI